jgi:AcrR family transcriptional regulator
MGTTERRTKERENLRRTILDAARELFVAHGFEAVSMRKIADRIDYSPTAIYLYFKDKDAILDTLIEEGFLQLCQCTETARTIADPLERLKTGARCYLRFARINRHYYRLMFEMGDCPKEKMAAEREDGEMPVGLRAFGFIRQCVSEGIALGRFRTDFEEIVLSHTAWAHVHGAVALLLAGRLAMLTEDQQEAFFESIVESSVRGLLPDCP